MSKNHYGNIANLFIPEYPMLKTEIKESIAFDAAVFIKKQLDLQPFYIAFPLRLFARLFAVSISLNPYLSLYCLRKLPYGSMIERLFRSLTMLIFLENEKVLEVLGEESGEVRADQYRKIRNNLISASDA